MPEILDGIDNDCDDLVDEDYEGLDSDQDGLLDPNEYNIWQTDPSTMTPMMMGLMTALKSM